MYTYIENFTTNALKILFYKKSEVGEGKKIDTIHEFLPNIY